MDQDQIGEYLNALRETRGLEQESARMAGVAMRDVVLERERSGEFRQQEQEIMKEISEVIRREVFRRGIDGIDQNVYYKGEVIATEKKYSDALLLALAKAYDPMFIEKKAITDAQGGPLKIVIEDFSNLSDKPPALEPSKEVIVVPGADIRQVPNPAELPVPSVNNQDQYGDIC